MADAHHPAPPFYRNTRRKRPTHEESFQVGTDPHVVTPAEGRVQNNMSVAPLVHTDGKGERVLYHSRSTRTVNKLTPE